MSNSKSGGSARTDYHGNHLMSERAKKRRNKEASSTATADTSFQGKYYLTMLIYNFVDCITSTVKIFNACSHTVKILDWNQGQIILVV